MVETPIRFSFGDTFFSAFFNCNNPKATVFSSFDSLYFLIYFLIYSFRYGRFSFSFRSLLFSFRSKFSFWKISFSSTVNFLPVVLSFRFETNRKNASFVIRFVLRNFRTFFWCFLVSECWSKYHCLQKDILHIPQ